VKSCPSKTTSKRQLPRQLSFEKWCKRSAPADGDIDVEPAASGDGYVSTLTSSLSSSSCVISSLTRQLQNPGYAAESTAAKTGASIEAVAAAFYCFVQHNTRASVVDTATEIYRCDVCVATYSA
jgi:hypothetical protein